MPWGQNEVTQLWDCVPQCSISILKGSSLARCQCIQLQCLHIGEIKKRRLWHPHIPVGPYRMSLYVAPTDILEYYVVHGTFGLNVSAHDLQNASRMSRKDCALKFLQGIHGNQASIGRAVPKALLPPIFFISHRNSPPPCGNVRANTRASTHSPV